MIGFAKHYSFPTINNTRRQKDLHRGAPLYELYSRSKNLRI